MLSPIAADRVIYAIQPSKDAAFSKAMRMLCRTYSIPLNAHQSRVPPIGSRGIARDTWT